MNPKKLAALTESARMEITTGFTVVYFSAVSEALPKMVETAVKAECLLPEETERITLMIWTQLHSLTAGTLRESTGKSVSLPIPDLIKALAQKHSINLNDVLKHVYGKPN